MWPGSPASALRHPMKNQLFRPLTFPMMRTCPRVAVRVERMAWKTSSFMRLASSMTAADDGGDRDIHM